MYLGIDIGGTFTDLVLMDEDGRISTAKALTTPGELENGVLNAVALAAKAQGVTPEALLGGGEDIRPRHDPGHQRADRAHRRQDRPDRHARLRRYARAAAADGIHRRHSGRAARLV